MSAELALQKALRAALVGSGTVTALVPAAAILDRHARPAPDPSIIIGEGQTLEGDDIARRMQRVVFDLHLWKKEQGLTGVRLIAAAIRAVLQAANWRFNLEAPYHCGDCYVSSVRYLRDPDGETSHGVMTLEAMIGEAA